MHKWNHFWGIFLLSLVLCTKSAAQPAPGQEALELEPVVISATGTEVPTKESTQSVTVITEKEIQERQELRVQEMLRYVPGAIISQNGGRGGLSSLYLRGGENDHAQLLFNGIRLNDTGGAFDFSLLTTDNLQSIEVVRGPMSALYGADAMTGVVNLRTKKGVGIPTLTLSSGWGPHYENGRWVGEQRASLLGSYKSFAFSLGYSRVDDPGILPYNGSFYQNTLVSRLDFSLRDNLSLTHHTLWLNNRLGYPTELSGDVFDPKARGGPGLDPNQNQRYNLLLQGLTLNYWPFSWWENEVTVGYTRREKTINDPYNPGVSDFDLWYGPYRSRDLESRFSLDYHSNFRFGSRNRMESISTLGFHYRDEQLKQWSWAPLSFWQPPAQFFKTSRHALAFYAQEQLNLYNRLFLVGGLRVEDNTVFSRTEVIPRGSAALRFPKTDTTLRAAGGLAIKEPTFVESYSQSQTSMANPKLKPEKNVSWEVGVDQYLWESRVQLSGTYFENNFTDFITYVYNFPNPGRFENIGAVKVTGLELAARARPVTGLTLGLAYTNLLYFKVTDDGGFDNLFFKTGRPLLRRPYHSFAFVVDYVFDRVNLNLSGLYVGRRDDSRFAMAFPYSRRVTNGDYFILNAAASYDLVRDWGHINKVQLWARLNNLTNRRYMEVYGYSSPRFSVMVGLRMIVGLKSAATQEKLEGAGLSGGRQGFSGSFGKEGDLVRNQDG